MTQNAFHFDFKAYGHESFIVSDCNRDAYVLIESTHTWQQPFQLIYGASSCGKSHLLKLWQNAIGATEITNDTIQHTFSGNSFIIDDVDHLHNEKALFHCLNHLKERGGYALMSASTHPSQFPFTLPDLVSRLKAITCTAIMEPDDLLLYQIFTKAFAERQLHVGDEVVHFLVSRIERSFNDVLQCVQRIDQAALNEKRTITIPFVKKVLAK